MKNENKSSDMIDILTHLHQYVPAVSSTYERLISTGVKVTTEKTAFHRILVGGDQLTAARAKSALKLKLNSQTPLKKLEGIVPVAEDWHTKVNFLKVSHKCVY